VASSSTKTDNGLLITVTHVPACMSLPVPCEISHAQWSLYMFSLLHWISIVLTHNWSCEIAC
jgi:hypothetical protein